MREIRAGQFYRHFKGGLYQTLAVAEHTETGERLVIYQALYGDYRIYARPYEMFAGEVDAGKYPEAGQRYRFQEITLRETEARPEGVSPAPREGTDPSGAEKAAPASSRPHAGQVSAEGVNPVLLEFLDAETLEEKIHILTCNRNQMDHALLNSIAISLDVVVETDDLQQKYDEIMSCLSIKKHFESSLIRQRR